MAMKNQPTLALDRVLRVLQPLVRLLLRNGVTYTVFAAALKRVFDPEFVDARGASRPLPKSGGPGSFDALVAGVSRDVRPKAVLDELQRLGVVHDTEAGLVLEGSGFAPRQGFEEMSWLFAQNLHDHAAAAVANLQGEANFLEQSVFVDELTAASAERLREVSVQAWRAAFRTVMQEAQQRFDADQTQASAGQRRHRARFGVYFYSEGES